MNKQVKSPFKRAGQGGNRRFLINAAVLAAGCLLVVQPLTGIWLGADFQDSMKYSPILIYSSVFSCFTTFMGSIYLAAKETKRSLITSLFSGIINVGLNMAKSFISRQQYLIIFLVKLLMSLIKTVLMH